MAALALAPWEPFARLPRASLPPMLVATADRHVLSLETYVVPQTRPKCGHFAVGIALRERSQPAL